MTVYAATLGFQWDGPTGQPPDLPSEAGVPLAPATTYYSSWEYEPRTYQPAPARVYLVEVDAEWVQDWRGPAAVAVGVAFHDGTLPDYDHLLAYVGDITTRGLYLGTGSFPVVVDGVWDVCWAEVAESQSEYLPLVVHSIRWWPAGPAGPTAPPPLRQTGRTDGLIGAPRQHRTSVRQLAGMR